MRTFLALILNFSTVDHGGVGGGRLNGGRATFGIHGGGDEGRASITHMEHFLAKKTRFFEVGVCLIMN